METSRITIIRTPKDNGMTAYSLQYNPPVSFGKGKAIRQEMLNIESYTNPKNEVELQFNQHVEIVVEEIRCTRYIQSVKHDFSLFTSNRDLDVVSYLEEHIPYGDKVTDAAVKSFKHFCNGRFKFRDVTVSSLTAYRDYLLKSCRTGKKRRYSNNTASSYLKHIKRLLSIAHSDRLIDFDPHDAVPGITWDHTIRKERLTDSEIESIRNTEFKDKTIKQAVLFSIFTGLRRSDVLNLKWENIEHDGIRYYMSITIKKTQNKVRLPLTSEAVDVLGTMKKTGPVFPLLTTHILVHRLPELIEAAGINKHITFHCFRHTFAMRLLDKDVDIVTIAFLLGHKYKGSALSYLNCSRDHLERVIEMLENSADTCR